MKPKNLLAGVLCLLTLNVFGQTGEVRGLVYAAGSPVEFATVTVKGTSIGQVTDGQGSFSLRNVPYGSYDLEVSFVGYKNLKEKLVINKPVIELKLELEELVNALDEVVISGTMKEVHKLQSSIPVEVYSPVLFKKNPVPNIFESLNLVNGVQPQINCNVCNTGDIHINGLEGPYTMVLIDGMPIVSSLSTVYGLSGIPNNLVKRIEVVKGPASTLYGSEAVGGVINIITKDPVYMPRLQADVFGTTVGEFNTDLSVSGKIGNAYTLVGLNHFRYNQARDINDDNFTDIPLQNRVSVFNKWNLPAGKKQASVAWRYFYEDRWGGELQWNQSFRGTDSIYGESIFTNRWEVIGNYPVNTQGDLQLDYSYNFHKQDSYYGAFKFFATQHVAFAQLRWNKTWGRHDVMTGLPIRYIHYDDSTPGTSDPEGINSPSVTWLPGVFVQDEIKFSDAITSLAGLRYDRHNVHGDIFTPRISFKWSPSSQSTFRLTAGSGYRVVNLFTEDHAALTGSREVVLTEALQPEQSWNVNLNYARNIAFADGFLNLDGSLFYTYFSNKIIGDLLTDPDKIIYDNLDGYAISKGVTLNTELNLTNGLVMLAGVTFMDVYTVDKDDTGEEVKIPQLFAPKVSGTFTLTAGSGKPWQADLTARVNGPMYLPVLPNDFRPDRSPWVPLINLQLTRVIKGKAGSAHWEIYGGVKNLLNFIPANPIMRPFDPFDKNVDVDNPNGYTFDTTYNYAPLQGLRGFLGLRLTLH